ncbi:MAG: hypothetical protein WAL47_03900 [Pyrinomonadaceae bacterium]
MLRIASLALVLVMSTGVLLPFADSSAHGLRQSFITKRNFHHRRHSRAWWRRYRARMARLRLKRRQEMAIMAHRKSVLRPVMPLRFAKAAPAPVAVAVPELVLSSIPGTVPASVAVPVPTATSVPATILPPASRKLPTPAIAPVPRSVMVSAPVSVTIPAPPAKTVAPSSQTTSARPLKSVRAAASVTVPAPAVKTVLAGASKPVAAKVRPVAPVAAASGPQLPTGWNALGASKTGEVKFRTETAAGVLNGQASLDVVAKSQPNPLYMSAREERRLLAGVAIADLRRIVIDKMISDGGWVTNDYFRDVAGQRVFIVSAQTPGDGRNPDKSWNFYFTEVNGRIYRLTTNTPQQFSERMAAEAESFIASFHAISKPAQ